MDAYTANEEKGRNRYSIMKEQLSPDIVYHFTEAKFESFDVEREDGSVDEIKNRDIPTYRYLDSGYMMEEIKYNELVKHNPTSRFIQFFNDGFTLSWEIGKIKDNNPHFEMMKCTCTTATNYGEQKYKSVTLLDFKDAEIWYYNIHLTEEKKEKAIEYLHKQKKQDYEAYEKNRINLIRELGKTALQ